MKSPRTAIPEQARADRRATAAWAKAAKAAETAAWAKAAEAAKAAETAAWAKAAKAAKAAEADLIALVLAEANRSEP